MAYKHTCSFTLSCSNCRLFISSVLQISLWRTRRLQKT